MTAYERRKALRAAYGSHVCDWRRGRWLEWRAASVARAEERRLAWEAERPQREAREAELREALADLRRSFVPLERYPAGSDTYFINGVADAVRFRACIAMGWVGVVSEERKGSGIVRRYGDFGDLWVE